LGKKGGGRELGNIAKGGQKQEISQKLFFKGGKGETPNKPVGNSPVGP